MSSSKSIPSPILQKISAEQAYHYRIVPSGEQNGTLFFKTDQKVSSQLQQELEIVLDLKVDFKYCESEELQKLLARHYRKSKEPSTSGLSYSSDFLERLLLNAKSVGSSDIHFEPYENRCRVRFRIDGKLLEQYSIEPNEYPSIINKIKIRAELDIAEKRLPQDGRISMKSEEIEFDIRVSSLPTLNGEKLVLRILSKDTSSLNLEQLGFSAEELEIFKESIKNPNGIILISGPTGSGKTTTLYATLKHLNNDSTNILTVEDPIEYTLEGINQVQLKENIGLDFSSTLKTFLRQDPDIIMVGEIRDVQTANMAIRAALTGHLVLSTIHTNSAWATVSRLIDMGVPPFLIASTLNISIAQRLVRILCSKCRTKVPLNYNELPKNFKPSIHLKTHYKAVGCSSCHYTGYNGRKAIYEILPITKELKKPIKSNEIQISDYIEKNNIRTLKSNAMRLVLDGVTTIEEVYSLLTD
ncbi:GspE/PulE family protein [Cytophaga sp. FL35]|uniref:GspE/PulE family protein n=1 Tax=Cytophaga sp. FL35 TaxID=1904456 RepID=UPI0016536CA0|nr:GspE/PulE family protein [Cytophaga sp. FL35]MBC6999649.1 type II/IV secretion system protein [Cytophaga sp. FL35]